MKKGTDLLVCDEESEVVEPVVGAGEAAGDGEGEGELGEVVQQGSQLGSTGQRVVVPRHDRQRVRRHPQRRPHHRQPQQQLGPITAWEARGQRQGTPAHGARDKLVDDEEH